MLKKILTCIVTVGMLATVSMAEWTFEKNDTSKIAVTDSITDTLISKVPFTGALKEVTFLYDGVDTTGHRDSSKIIIVADADTVIDMTFQTIYDYFCGSVLDTAVNSTTGMVTCLRREAGANIFAARFTDLEIWCFDSLRIFVYNGDTVHPANVYMGIVHSRLPWEARRGFDK